MSATATVSPASCLYTGVIRHRRHEVRASEFRHRLTLAYLDLDELPTLLGGRLVHRGPGFARLRRGDLFGDPETPVGTAVAGEIERQTGARPEGPIRVLTGLRSLGLAFNPVRFYLGFDAAGRQLRHVLAEVTNTPWGERHAYAVSGVARDGVLTGESAKQLHVSPFMDMDQRYRWRVTDPGRRLEVHIENRRGDAVAFEATLAVRRHELTRSSLARMSARDPVASLRMLALIYGHAAGLKLRGVPVHPHPPKRTAARGGEARAV